MNEGITVTRLFASDAINFSIRVRYIHMTGKPDKKTIIQVKINSLTVNEELPPFIQFHYTIISIDGPNRNLD